MIQIKMELLRNALQRMAWLFVGKPGLPILECVILETIGDNLFASATDLDTALRVRIDADGEGIAKVAVPYRLLLAWARHWRREFMQLTTDTTQLIIRPEVTDNWVALNYQPAADYPGMNFQEAAEPAYIIPATQLRRGLSSVIKAASADANRHIINSVEFRGAVVDDPASVFRCIATDGRRIHAQNIFGAITTATPAQGISGIIRSKAVKGLLAVMSAGDIQIRKRDADIWFGNCDFQLVTKPIEGKYPDMASVIPATHPQHITGAVDTWLTALRGMMPLITAKYWAMRLCIENDRTVMTVNNHQLACGSNCVLPIEYMGPEITLAFHPKYLIDALMPIQGGSFDFGWTGANQAITIQSLTNKAGEPDTSFRAVVMPTRA